MTAMPTNKAVESAKNKSSSDTKSRSRSRQAPSRTPLYNQEKVPTKSVPQAACIPAPRKTNKSNQAHPLPSAMLHKHKQASVFSSGQRKHKTNFSSAYDAGLIPCRINHGSIRHSLHWTTSPQDLRSYDPLLITCVEGFLETEHPFVFLARTIFRDLLQLENAREKTVPILAQLIVPLRRALMAKDDETFLMALEAMRLLSELVEGELNSYLSKLTQQIHRKLLTKSLRPKVEDTLAVLESNGGNEALAIIRAKIPTYVSSIR